MPQQYSQQNVFSETEKLRTRSGDMIGEQRLIFSKILGCGDAGLRRRLVQVEPHRTSARGRCHPAKSSRCRSEFY